MSNLPFFNYRFVSEFYREPKRGYGANILEVFHKLKVQRFEDIWKPAKEQFDGSGSYGNGGAMRIAPVALYFNDNYKGMLDVAQKCTELTHTHRLGVNGALLQVKVFFVHVPVSYTHLDVYKRQGVCGDICTVTKLSF